MFFEGKGNMDAEILFPFLETFQMTEIVVNHAQVYNDRSYVCIYVQKRLLTFGRKHISLTAPKFSSLK